MQLNGGRDGEMVFAVGMHVINNLKKNTVFALNKPVKPCGRLCVLSGAYCVTIYIFCALLFGAGSNNDDKGLLKLHEKQDQEPHKFTENN